jgi:site-specific DNA recombinase
MLEEDFYINKTLPQETFEKFHKKLRDEKAKIQINLLKVNNVPSNLEGKVRLALQIATKLPAIWRLSDVGEKEKLQQLIFSEGIILDNKNTEFRTKKINEIFNVIVYRQTD